MLTELDLLSVLKNKANYYRFKPYIKDHALTEHGARIIKDLDSYFKVNPTLIEVDWQKFAEWFKLVKNPTMKQANQEIASKVFNNLSSHVTSLSEKQILNHFVSLDYAGRVQTYIQDFISGKETNLDKIQDIVDALNLELDNVIKHNDSFSKTKLNEVLDKTFRKGGLDWKLQELNVSIGPLHKGDLIIVATRPETGKTSFAVDQTCFMARQLPVEDTVLWINNEEQGERIILRAYQSILNQTLPDILKDEAKSTIDYETYLGRQDKIVVADDTSFSVHDIDRICKEINPKLIIINVLDKLQGFEGEKEVDRFRKLAVWARRLAKTYGPVFCLCQADGSAEGQKWVYKDQIYGSKTGVQGEADAIITIGMVNDPAFQGTRYIHVPKNKLPGGPKSDPKERHGYFEVGFDIEKCQFYTKGGKP